MELNNSTIVRTRSDEGGQARVLEIFEEHRTRLTIQAYRLTRSWVDAEDVVQGAWIRWAAHCATVTAPTSWLYRVTSNIAIDHLRKNARRRESFTTEIGDMTSAGSDPHAVIELQEDVCAGVRILLESLSSLERAVFVIRRVGRCSHIETAMALRRTPAAVRQLDRRAGLHFTANSKRFTVSNAAVHRITQQLMYAASMGELERMVGLLAPEVPIHAVHAAQASGCRSVNT